MNKRWIFWLAAISIGLVVGAIVFLKRGIPFVTEREQWTIGIYEGDSPFDFPARQLRWNPIMRAEDVTDVPAKFVADPFLVQEEETWHLFFEVYNLDTAQGDLAVATSGNGRSWEYQQIIIDEEFHLSYPYVFPWQGDYYLIPESFEANGIRLYKATEFPTQWEFVTTLVDGRELVDPSIAYYNDQWWLFAAGLDNDDLFLFFADDLLGPWQEHPMSPVVLDDVHKARPSGRMIVQDGRLYRYTMDVAPPTGTHQVWAYEITDISPTTYAEVRVGDTPILQPDGRGWNGQAMHQIDPVRTGPNSWKASVDGFGKYLVFGLDY